LHEFEEVGLRDVKRDTNTVIIACKKKMNAEFFLTMTKYIYKYT
jgi:hypothetical protein